MRIAQLRNHAPRYPEPVYEAFASPPDGPDLQIQMCVNRGVGTAKGEYFSAAVRCFFSRA